MSRKNEGNPKGEIKQNVNIKLKEWLVLAKHGKFVDEVDITKLERPSHVGKNEVPENLNMLTLGQLLQLQEMSDWRDTFFVPCRVLFGMKDEEVAECKALEVVCLSSWVAREMERIGKLWKQCSAGEPTSEERQAGIDRLDFGLFGIIDGYARRMGITDHEEVEKVPWLRVWKCMQMDAEVAAYNKRLNEVYKRKNERRKR